MIQRFSVQFQGSERLQDALAGLKEIGFSDDAVRVWQNDSSGWIDIHSYRDGDVDTTKRLDPDRMEDYCVMVWSRIGYARIILTEFDGTGKDFEFGKKEYETWHEG